MFPLMVVVYASIYVGNCGLVCPFDAERYNEKMKVLAIENHEYGRIEPGTLDGVQKALPKLETLIIRNTSILSIAPETFYPFRTLKCLDLSRNELSVLVGLLFRGLGNLETLILAQNRIKILPESVFLELKNVMQMDLSSNKMTEISDSAFRGLERLEELHLENNDLTFVSSLTFEHISSLKRLFISHNPLHFVGTFALKQLNVLSASDSALSVIPNLPETIESADFSRSNLSVLDHSAFSHLPVLSELWLSGNPWTCDCRSESSIKFLIQWIALKDREHMVCAQPKLIEGLSFRDSLKLLSCQQLAQIPRDSLTPFSLSHLSSPPWVTSSSVTEPVSNHGRMNFTGGIHSVSTVNPSHDVHRRIEEIPSELAQPDQVELNAGLSDIQLRLPEETSNDEPIRDVSEPRISQASPTDHWQNQQSQEPRNDTSTNDSTRLIMPNVQTGSQKKNISETNNPKTLDSNSNSFLNGKVSLKVVLLSLLFGVCAGVLVLLLVFAVKTVRKRRKNGIHRIFARRSSCPPSPLCTVSPYCGDVIMRNSFGFRDNEYRSGNFALVSARHTLFPGLFASTFDEQSNSAESPTDSINSTSHLCPASAELQNEKTKTIDSAPKTVAFAEELSETLEYSARESSLSLSSPCVSSNTFCD